ncbi:MAG: substrate-binding domain-containing protein [Nitrospirae bacterium]|nr:substrate-binding domain-containing protein [Nitrospirota bacterium]
MGRYIICILFLFLLFPAAAFSSEVLTGSGCSVSTTGYLIDLSKEYEKETGVKMHIMGGGSPRGLADILAGNVDFSASCVTKTKKDSDNLEYVQVAWDALVFVVHKSNPVNSITQMQVRDIYAGQIDNWKQLGGPNMKLISFIPSDISGGVIQSLTSTVLKGKSPEQQKNSSVQAASAAIWEQLVEKTPEGFASSGFSSARKRNVKMLNVNGVQPTKANIISNKYPLRRPLYLVVKKDASPKTKRFLDYVLSPKAQKLIASYGSISLAEIK